MIAASLALSISAQKIEKPKLTPVAATPAQDEIIREGIALHDAKRYDEAIKKYEQVLKENPDCTFALYELALSQFTKKDNAAGATTARTGAKYKSPELGLFYLLIANDLDDSGKGAEAIELYKDAIKFVKSDKTLSGQLASLNYNLAVTHFRRKEYLEARAVLKEGVLADFNHAGSNYMLAQIFANSQYRIPAFLAASRFIGIDQGNNARTQRAAAMILDVLKKPVKDEKTGNTVISLDFFAAKDEGDFGVYDLLGAISGIETDEDKKENKTENERFVESYASMISMLADDKKLKNTFVGKTYIPYLDALKKAGHHEALAYLVMQEAGNVEATKWISINARKVLEYQEWSKAYKPPAK
jgi:tetratricopeptide (TPR) repeat protein